MMNLRNGRRIDNLNLCKGRTNMEAAEQLTEFLRDSSNIPEPKADFRKLVTKYSCLAKPGGDSSCTRYSPGPSGNCSLQNQAADGSFICLYTGVLN